MKKILCALLCFVLLSSACAVSASAHRGYYCGGSAEAFTPVGDCEITWDPEASQKLDLRDGDLSDWLAAGYPVVEISPNNMISWVGATDDNPTGGIPEGWGIEACFVADPDYLYLCFNITDPEVVLVSDASQYTAGDSIQLAFDFDRILAKVWEEDYDAFSSALCNFYSFGPMGEGAPIQIKQQNSVRRDGVISEANGDGIRGATSITENGWCAEFSFTWNQIYDDCRWHAYHSYYDVSVTVDDTLEIGMALYYLNHDAPNTDFSWGACTLADRGIENGMPEVTWTVYDHGMPLFLEYNPDMVINCEGIHVYTTIDDTTPAVTDVSTEIPTNPATEVPAEELASTPAEVPTEEPTESGDTDGTDGGCGAVMAVMPFLMMAALVFVFVKKKE